MGNLFLYFHINYNYGYRNLTLPENIADAGGINLAFQAWKAISGNTSEPLLPGFEKYSPEKVKVLRKYVSRK
jgi:predicted metalloendopeptidase